MKAVSNKLREIRIERGVSINQLAKRSGVARWRISAIEKGGVDLRLSTAAALADALGIGLNEIWPAGGTGIEPL